VAEKNLYAGLCKPGDFKRAKAELARSGVENFFCNYCGEYVEGERDIVDNFFSLRCPLCGQLEKDNAGNIRWRCSSAPVATATGAKKRLFFVK